MWLWVNNHKSIHSCSNHIHEYEVYIPVTFKDHGSFTTKATLQADSFLSLVSRNPCLPHVSHEHKTCGIEAFSKQTIFQAFPKNMSRIMMLSKRLGACKKCKHDLAPTTVKLSKMEENRNPSKHNRRRTKSMVVFLSKNNSQLQSCLFQKELEVAKSKRKHQPENHWNDSIIEWITWKSFKHICKQMKKDTQENMTTKKALGTSPQPSPARETQDDCHPRCGERRGEGRRWS